MSPILGIMASSISGSKSSTTAFESIATVTVGSGGQSTITFNSIPSTYKHLQIRGIGRTGRASTEDNIRVTFNSDTGTNYSWHNLAGYGTGVEANGNATQTGMNLGWITAANDGASIFGTAIIDILDYANTSKNKTSRSLTGYDWNGGGQIILASGSWQNTSAINSITLTPVFSTFAQYSSFALYGIKGA
jgi:hypothetical protein